MGSILAKVKKKKRRHLKYGFKKFLVYFIALLLIAAYTVRESFKAYKEYLYKQTYEYKINSLGYSMDETTYMINNLSNERLNYLLSVEYDELYYEIFTQKYYLDKNFETYLEYYNSHEDVELSKVIALVNVHANLGWYNVTYEADSSNEYTVLVNKFYYLSKDYKRDDIVDISPTIAYYDNSASSVVVEAYEKMRADVKEALDIDLMINSSYRSYEEQEEIYDEYSKLGQSYADSYAARPGFSEHQTGLAIDMTSLQHPYRDEFTQSEEYEWLKNNCYKYGFILRYPEGKEDITGYSTESWHFRYVGVEVATIIYEEDITFDEYYAYYIEG